MKISELIEELQIKMNQVGDIECYCWPYDGQVLESKVDKLNLFLDDDTKEFMLWIEAEDR